MKPVKLNPVSLYRYGRSRRRMKWLKTQVDFMYETAMSDESSYERPDKADVLYADIGELKRKVECVIKELSYQASQLHAAEKEVAVSKNE